MKKIERREKQIHIAVTGVFCLFVFGMAVLNLFAPKKDFSENENRVLNPFPSVTVQNIFFGSFDTEFENWFSDHFAGRDNWIRRKASVRIDLCAIDNNGVWLAKDQRLIQQFLTYDEGTVSRNISYLQEFSEENDTKLNILLVPGAYYGEQEYLPFGAAGIDEKELIETIGAELSDQKYLDITDAIRAIPDGYFRTDHHWNEKGAAIGYELICKEVLQKEPEPYTFTQVSDSFQGTMYSRSGVFWTPAEPVYRIDPETENPVAVTFENGTSMPSLYAEEHLQEKDKYTYYLDGNHGYEHIETSVHNGKRAVVIKDSFAHILLPFMAQEYETIDVFDLRYYTDSVSSFLLECEPDVYVIYGLETFCYDNSLAALW